MVGFFFCDSELHIGVDRRCIRGCEQKCALVCAMAQTVRIDPAAYAILSELARASRLTLTETLTRAVGAYEREVFLQGLGDDFASLRADRQKWAEEQTERAGWVQTNADGLGDE